MSILYILWMVLKHFALDIHWSTKHDLQDANDHLLLELRMNFKCIYSTTTKIIWVFEQTDQITINSSRKKDETFWTHCKYKFKHVSVFFAWIQNAERVCLLKTFCPYKRNVNESEYVKAINHSSCWRIKMHLRSGRAFYGDTDFPHNLCLMYSNWNWGKMWAQAMPFFAVVSFELGKRCDTLSSQLLFSDSHLKRSCITIYSIHFSNYLHFSSALTGRAQSLEVIVC